MKTTLLAFVLLAFAGCNSDTFSGDAGADSGEDGSVSDAANDGVAEGGKDGGPRDADTEAGCAVVCEAGTVCCLIPSSQNFQKCYAVGCLACCQ